MNKLTEFERDNLRWGIYFILALFIMFLLTYWTVVELVEWFVKDYSSGVQGLAIAIARFCVMGVWGFFLAWIYRGIVQEKDYFDDSFDSE